MQVAWVQALTSSLDFSLTNHNDTLYYLHGYNLKKKTCKSSILFSSSTVLDDCNTKQVLKDIKLIKNNIKTLQNDMIE